MIALITGANDTRVCIFTRSRTATSRSMTMIDHTVIIYHELPLFSKQRFSQMIQILNLISKIANLRITISSLNFMDL